MLLVTTTVERRQAPLGTVDVLVVDPERTFAEGLALGLALESRTGLVWSASSADDALHRLQHVAPRVVVVGVEPGSWQVGFLDEVRRRHPEVGLVVLTADEGTRALGALVVAGARGWLPKSAPLAEVSQVISAVADGEWWLPRAVLGEVVQNLVREQDAAAVARLERLTGRERQVLVGMAEGLSREEIAARLRLSVNTVRTHAQNVLAKLGVHTSLEAVTIALREGLGAGARPAPTGSPRRPSP